MNADTKACMNLLRERIDGLLGEIQYCTSMLNLMGQGYVTAKPPNADGDFEVIATEEGKALTESLCLKADRKSVV